MSPRPARPLALLALPLLLGLAAVPALEKGAAAATTPARISSVSSKPGPKAGQVVISWTTSGEHTTGYRIDTALSIFSRTDSRFPRQGRHFTSFTVKGGSKRSVTLTAADTARAGAPAGSANHLWFRVYALNGSTERAFGKLQAVEVAPPAVKSGRRITVASFNVRTATAAGDTGSRRWSARVPAVARQIVTEDPGLVAVQELSPGTMSASNGGVRQTVSLLNALRKAGGGTYALTRTTSYAKPGTAMGTQGARILYDKSRYALKNECAEMTGSSHWSAACTIRLPLRPGDSGKERRVAAVARFADRATGKQFYFVSVHLDARRGTGAEGRSLEALRGAQLKAVTDRMAAKNKKWSTPLPVIIAGDLNTWQNSPAGYAPHDALIKAGYLDTAAAKSRINIRHTTMNDFATTLKISGALFGARLDVIAVKGGRGGAVRFENVMRVTDAHRPSDHNMIMSTFTLP